MAACGLWVLGVAWTTPDARAQDAVPQRYAETVVVTATADPVRLGAVPKQVSVVTAEEIARLPVRTIADLLSYAGVDVRTRGPFGAQADLSIRGAGFGQVVVLVNGVRINDAQTGHHNADIPVPLSAIDCTEIVRGSGSSLHGADAVGGTINVITRRTTTRPVVRVSAGSFGLLEGEVSAGGSWTGVQESVSISARRTSGFTFDRELADLAASSQTGFGGRTTLFVSHLRKAFGANGFYGPSPSKEWTNQTLVSLQRTSTPGERWALTTVMSYRTHGDRFLWDVRQPAGFESRHRTHAATGVLKAQRAVSERTHLTAGAEVGADWMQSSTLGGHAYGHAGLFAEVRQAIGAASWLYPGLRYDAYSASGGSASPSLGVAISPAGPVTLRASVGRAFRIPSFTERYYRDPAHQADPGLGPEHAWTVEGGADWRAGAAWLVSGTVFRRWDQDLIDWVRPTATDTWRSANIRRVDTHGLEVAVRRPAGAAGTVALQYAYLDVRPDALDLLSKYTLDYARHRATASATVALPAGLVLGQRLDLVARMNAPRAWIWDARITRAFGELELSVEASNLLDRQYQEVRGVDMPGRWARVSLRWAAGGRAPGP